MGNAQQRSSSQNRLQSVKSMSALLDMSKGSPHRSPLAALLQAAKLERHPRLAQRPLRVAELGLIAHDVKVHAADLVAQAVKLLGLHREILVLGTHLVQLLLGAIRARDDGLAAALEVVEGLFLGADGLHVIADRVLVGRILRETTREVREEVCGCAENVLRWMSTDAD